MADAFEKPFALGNEAGQRLADLEKRIVKEGADPVVTALLGEMLRHAPAQEVSRIRPLELARRRSLDPALTIWACLLAAKEGALELGWDLVCPSCRTPAQMKDTLRALKDHGRCEVCSLDFALDLASSVELVFSAHASIRVADPATYCLSSPAHTPHVVAQIRIDPGERFQLELDLTEGQYQFTGRRLGYRFEFRVQAGAPTGQWALLLSKGAPAELRRVLTPGRQTLVLENDTPLVQLVRIERGLGREDALTAARVASQPLFRRLFPQEVLAPGQLVTVSNVTLLMVEVATRHDERQDTDSQGFSERYAMFRRLEERAGAEGGAVVKIAGEGVVAVFTDAPSAVRAALSLSADPLPLRAAVHRGPTAALTLNEHLDYFGRTVREAARLLTLARPRELLVSEAVATEAGVLQLLSVRTKRASVVERDGIACQRIDLTPDTSDLPTVQRGRAADVV